MAVKKKSKAKDNNKLPMGNTKIVDIYTDMFFLKEKPVSEAFLDRLFSEMVEWAKKDDSLKITDFFWERGVPNQMVYRWKEKYPQYQRIYEFVLERLASRREVGAITRKYDASAIEKYQPLYDPQYKALLEWRASLADKNKDAQGTLVVQMMPAPTTTVVPERKKVDE